MALDIMRMASHVQKGFEDGANRKRESEGRRLIALAAQGDKEATKQLYSVDPAAAQQMQTQQKAMDAEVANLMWRGATAIKNATPDQKPAIYSAVLAEVAKHPKSGEWTAMLPPQYDPATVDPAVDQLLARTGLYQDTAKASEQPALVRGFDEMMVRLGAKPGSEEYVKAARVWANLDPKAKVQILQDAGGGFNAVEAGGGQPATATPVITGGAPAPSAPAPTESPFPKKMSDAEIMAMANKMAAAGAPEQAIQGFINAQKSMPDMAEFASVTNVPPASAPTQGQQLMGPKKGPAGNGSYSQLSAAEVQAMGLPAGTVAQRGPNGQVSVISKPEAKKTKEISADVIKNAAQLPALARRIDRLAQASEKITGMLDGGKFDQYLISATNEATELESAAAQLRPLLLSFVRVPGIGSQSDLEARLDGMQYPDISQPPATRQRNIDELRKFIVDLSNAYKSMAGNGAAPAAPSGGLTPAQQALLDKY